jgi:Fur family peroxide stress response transcriptional regulator
MKTQNDRLRTLETKLKARGQRVTAQRMAVLEALTTDRKHPGIEDIYARVKEDFPMISLATVYKTINMLEEIGEVMELNTGEDHHRYDGFRPYPHPHLICTRCRRIIDIEAVDLEKIAQKVAHDTGYSIQSERLDIYGICPECQKEINTQSKSISQKGEQHVK